MYKGSVVVKKTELLDWIENANSMFKTLTGKDVRHMAWGQAIALERILEDDYHKFNHNKWTQDLWDKPWTNVVMPSETFVWLFDPTPLEREEQIHLYTLLNWHMENKDRVYEVLKELGEEI